nr:hypothetical protein B0A51_09913 [Rachicladosporium sp. CCFEE 5018]OQO22390.1 hypothetical protein B0A51_10853 [Rachicladosporium sp. CCFEE 5018]
MGSPTGTASPAGSSSNGRYASYVPHDLPYNEAYENAIMHITLHPDPNAKKGIRVIPEGSNEQLQEGISVRAADILWESLPVIAETDLPLPLDDPRRIYASQVPGILLTHPGGYHEGGPGLDPEMDTFAEDFTSRHGEVQNSAQLKVAKDKDVKANLELLKKQMLDRQKAVEHNTKIHSQLKALTEQHELELKLLKNSADEQRVKREARERKKREREAAAGTK